jgi:hypothetical protein
MTLIEYSLVFYLILGVIVAFFEVQRYFQWFEDGIFEYILLALRAVLAWPTYVLEELSMIFRGGDDEDIT